MWQEAWRKWQEAWGMRHEACGVRHESCGVRSGLPTWLPATRTPASTISLSACVFMLVTPTWRMRPRACRSARDRATSFMPGML